MDDTELQNNQSADLGLGDKVIQENRTRFINKDGSFNVFRKGVFDRGSFSPYHAILNASWSKFFLGVLIYYLASNLIFTLCYLATGRGGFPQIESLTEWQRFGQLFFYSIQVISTLGSSPLHPNTIPADILLAIESLIGLFGFAVGASLLFARFSNPATKILFSTNAVIAPYDDVTGFMIRIINGRSNEFVQVNAVLTLAMNDKSGKRTFQVLHLERDSVLVFPLNWTIVHPINSQSPIFGMSELDLNNAHAEFLLSITATDQDLSKKVYARSSYLYNEVIVNAKFAYIIETTADGAVIVDPGRISEIEKI